jgi:hypothetical protein
MRQRLKPNLSHETSESAIALTPAALDCTKLGSQISNKLKRDRQHKKPHD